MLAQNAIIILIARFLGGFVGGGTFVILSVFIAEISENHIRGFLSSSLVFMCNVGVLFAFVIGDFYSYHTAILIYTIFPLLFCIGVFFLPETPVFLIRNGKLNEAKKSLAFYRNVKEFSIEADEIYETELKIMTDNKDQGEVRQNSLKLNDFCEYLYN